MKSISIIFLRVRIVCMRERNAPTLTEDLAKNDWQKTSILMSVDSILDTVPTIDLFASLSPCKKDNVWHFDATNNTFTLDEGATKCDAADPQTKDQAPLQSKIMEVN